MTDRARIARVLAAPALYALFVLLAPVDAGWRIAAGPLFLALAIAPQQRPLLLAAAPLLCLTVRSAAVSGSGCACGPVPGAIAVASALVAGPTLPLADAALFALGPLAANLIDLSAAGWRDGVVQPLRTGDALPIVASMLALVGTAAVGRIRFARWLLGLTACVVVATGLSWRQHLEVPALAHVLGTSRPGEGPWRARLTASAYRRLLARGDAAAFGVLLAHARDERLPALYDAVLARLGADGEQLIERELTAFEQRARLLALKVLAKRGSLAARPAYQRALASHHVPWPRSQRTRARFASELVTALEGADRIAWWPATIELLGTDPGSEALPPLAESLYRLRGAGTAPPKMADFRLLWEGSEGVRLAAGVALCLHPDGVGRAGEAPRLVQLMAEARVGDSGGAGLTACGPTAPQRTVLFGELLGRDRLGEAALEAATRDPVGAVARIAKAALDARRSGQAFRPERPVGGGRILDWIDLRAPRS